MTRPLSLMPFSLRSAGLWLVLLAGCGHSDVGKGGATATTGDPGRGKASLPAPSSPPSAPAIPDSITRPDMPRTPTPEIVRGLYVNRWAAIGTRMWDLVDIANRTEINSLVIDIKDDRGYLLYQSAVPLAHEIGADTVRHISYRHVQMILDTLRKYNIYPIARIVVAKDPLLAQEKPELAIKNKSTPSKSWLDKNGNPWLDPTHPEVWRYAGDLAIEAVKMGFSEVQFDYVRFPDEDRIIREGTYAHMNGRSRAQVIHDQLGSLRAQLAPYKVPVTIDVFGLTATDTTDMGIGQQWELFVNQVDVVHPMDYPSHFALGSYKLPNPNAKPYETIDHALRDATRRSAGIAGAAKIVPWYQDFTDGPPHYGAAEVRAQIEAGYANGFKSWMLWNARSAYTLEALKPAIEKK